MTFKLIAKCSASFKIKEVQIKLGFHGDSDSKESACNAGHLGLIPGLGRSTGGGHGDMHRYSCLENPRDRGAWQDTVHEVTKSWT